MNRSQRNTQLIGQIWFLEPANATQHSSTLTCRIIIPSKTIITFKGNKSLKRLV